MYSQSTQAARRRRPAAQGRPRRLACPGCQKPREGQRGKEGRFRYPRGPASWPARVPTLGCPSPYICLQKRIPDMFFQKISKNFSIDARKVYLLDKSCVVDIEELLEMWE